MTNQQSDTGTRLLRGALAGLVAGAVASLAMDRFQAAVSALSSDSGGGGEPATEKAADALARNTVGEPVPEEDKPLAGQTVHYALGIGLGVAYGVAAEFREEATFGQGAGFGLATALVLDEAVVPALGLGDPPWETDARTQLFSFASHLVFGVVAEQVRRQVAKTMKG